MSFSEHKDHVDLLNTVLSQNRNTFYFYDKIQVSPKVNISALTHMCMCVCVCVTTLNWFLEYNVIEEREQSSGDAGWNTYSFCSNLIK